MQSSTTASDGAPSRARRALLARLPVLLAGASVLAPARAQQADLLAKVRAGAPLRIANTQSSPPWSLLDRERRVVGYDVDVAREMARRMEIRIVFVADTYKNFVAGLRTQKYDVVMNDLTPTPARLRQVDFAAPYGVEDFRIFVRRENATIRERADLHGKKVGVTVGTSNESWARAHLKGSDIRAYNNGGHVFADLTYGRIDAVIASHFGGQGLIRTVGLPLKEVGPPLVYQLAAPALPHGQLPLREAMSRALHAMRSDGTLDRMARQWLGPEYQMDKMIAIAHRQAAGQE